MRACEEEMQSQSRPGEMSIGQKEKVGMPVVSECAAVERGICETESRWGTCQWQVWRWTPSSDNDVWGNQWCLMHGGQDRCHYSTKPYTSKNKAIFFKWKWKRNDRRKTKYLWDDLNKEKEIQRIYFFPTNMMYGIVYKRRKKKINLWQYLMCLCVINCSAIIWTRWWWWREVGDFCVSKCAGFVSSCHQLFNIVILDNLQCFSQ